MDALELAIQDMGGISQVDVSGGECGERSLSLLLRQVHVVVHGIGVEDVIVDEALFRYGCECVEGGEVSLDDGLCPFYCGVDEATGQFVLGLLLG